MKVKYYPFQPHCFAFGGFDMQMLNALNSVVKSGVSASKLDIWERDEDFDIIHLWGVSPHNFMLIDWTKLKGKKIVATLLLPYFDTLRSRLGHIYRINFSSSFKSQVHYFKKIDRFVVVNEIQAEILFKYYKVPINKIDVIPNIVEDNYFNSSNVSFEKIYNISNYVLCTGNICQRKNQYNLALACTKLKLNLVLIGNVLDGELAYGEKLQKLVDLNKNILWLKELPKSSDYLVSAYQDCLIFALPSLDETQPISLLEAVAMKKKIVTLNKTYAKQKYYKNAFLSKSPNVQDIEIALLECIKSNFFSINEYILDCKEKAVGIKYDETYRKCFY